MTSQLYSDDQLRRWGIDLLKRNLRMKLGGYGVLIKPINPGNLLYRGVQWNERPTQVSQVSYPPACRAKLGRANRAGTPMFYGCRAAAGVCFEIKAKPGDCIALSEWEVLEQLWMHNLGYHEDALNKMGVSSRGPRLALSHPIRNESRQNERLRRRLSLAFTEDVSDEFAYRYKQTIAMCELLFDGASPLPTDGDAPRFDRAAGIVYPAMRMKGATDNVVLWPEFVRSSMRIRSVRYVMVEECDAATSSYSLTTLAIANAFDDGKILWTDKLPAGETSRSSITLEGNVWVLRDGIGRAYDWHPAD